MKREERAYPVRLANVLFGLVHGLYWAGNCMFLGFMVTYLTAEGYNTSLIGVLMSLMTMLSIFVQPVLGYLSDTYVPVKVISLVLLAVLIPMGLVIPAVVAVPLLASVIVVALGLLTNTLAPLLEVWTIRSGEEHPGVKFGFTRSMGSLGYSFLALFMGRAFEKIGVDKMFAFGALFFGALILVVLLIPGIACANKRGGQGEKGKKQAKGLGMLQVVKLMVKKPAYVFFLLFFILTYTSMKTTSTFYPVLIGNYAGMAAASALGIGLFISALSEMPSMMFSDRLIRRFGAGKLMVVAGLGYILRYIIYYFASNVLTLQLANLTQMITYGILYPSVLTYLRQLAPEQVAGTAITATLAIANTVSSILGPMVFGAIIEYLSMDLCLLLCIVISALGLAAFAVSRRFAARETATV